ncbi:MAG: hypothetical protein RLY93_10420 [Sumerlaeia bacterium]
MPPKGSVVLNEVVPDSRGGNPELEFIELYTKRPAMELAGLSVVIVESQVRDPNLPKPGEVIWRADLPAGAVSDRNGFFLLANERTAQEYNVKPGLMWPNKTNIVNDPITVALMPTQVAPDIGTVVPLDTPLNSQIYDSVALLGTTEAQPFFGAPTVGPDRIYIAAGATRVSDGVDTNQSSDWSLADIEGPPQTFNTPGSRNHLPEEMIAVSRPVEGEENEPREQEVTLGKVVWKRYSPLAMQEAVRYEGSAMIYVRRGDMTTCRVFEQSYLLHSDATPLLSGKPVFFLNVNEPGAGNLARELGVYRVPSLVTYKQGRDPRHLIYNPRTTTPREIYDFMVSFNQQG